MHMSLLQPCLQSTQSGCPDAETFPEGDAARIVAKDLESESVPAAHGGLSYTPHDQHQFEDEGIDIII